MDLLESRTAVELPGGILDGQYMIVYSDYLPDQLLDPIILKKCAAGILVREAVAEMYPEGKIG